MPLILEVSRFVKVVINDSPPLWESTAAPERLVCFDIEGGGLVSGAYIAGLGGELHCQVHSSVSDIGLIYI